MHYVTATDDGFDEAAYLFANPDVADAVKARRFASGRAHLEARGRLEGRRQAVAGGAARMARPAGMRLARDLLPKIDKLATRRRDTFPEIADEIFWRNYERACAYSMVHVTGFYNVYQSLKHIRDNAVPGALVECGCFLGGVTIFMANVAREIGLARHIHAFDSFKGFPAGTSDTFLGKISHAHVLDDFKAAVEDNIAAQASEPAGITLTQGYVEDTLPQAQIGEIALLRLDTDFYASTRVELEQLYPRLASGGTLIIDDYGYFEGARRATDEYLARLDRKPLLNRIDQGVWAGVKP